MANRISSLACPSLKNLYPTEKTNRPCLPGRVSIRHAISGLLVEETKERRGE